MGHTTKPPSDDAKIAAKELWFSLPKEKRSVRHVTDQLNKAGHKVSKTSIGKWSKTWTESPVEQTAQKFLPAPAVTPSADDAFDGISDELRNALSPRLLALTPGKGLDRAENAVIKLVDAIAEKAPEIAAQLLDAESETTETTKGDEGAESRTVIQKAQVARSAVTAIATLAQAMQVISASRHLAAMSHRNFAEGDMLAAQAEVHRAQARRIGAEAEAIAKQARGDGSEANIIDATYSEVPKEDRNAALDALRGMAAAPKK